MCDPVCRGPCGVHCFFGLAAGVGVALAGRTAAVVVCVPVVVVVCVVVSQLTSIIPNPIINALTVQICMGRS